MVRALGFLAPLAVAAALIVWLAVAAQASPEDRLALTAVAIVSVVAGMTTMALLAWSYFGWRLGRDRLGARANARRPSGRSSCARAASRPSAAWRAPSIRRPATYLQTELRATHDRLTGVANRETLLTTLARRDRARHAPLPAAERRLHRHRPLQADQRHARPQLRRRGAAPGRRGSSADSVRASDAFGRYGGEEFMLILPETTPEDAVGLAEKLRNLVMATPMRIAGDQTITSHYQHRCRRRGRLAAPAGHAGRSGRCGDVRRQVARPQPHLPVPRARRGGPGAPRTDLGRAPRAGHRHRTLGERHRHPGARLGARAAAAPSRPAVGHDRVPGDRASPSRWAWPTRRSSASGSRRCSTTSARSPSRRRSSTSRARSPTASGRPSASTLASARSSWSRRRACARRSRSSCITTSASTAAATRTACAATRSRSARGSSRSPTRITPWSTTGPTARRSTHAEALARAARATPARSSIRWWSRCSAAIYADAVPPDGLEEVYRLHERTVDGLPHVEIAGGRPRPPPRNSAEATPRAPRARASAPAPEANGLSGSRSASSRRVIRGGRASGSRGVAGSSMDRADADAPPIAGARVRATREARVRTRSSVEDPTPSPPSAWTTTRGHRVGRTGGRGSTARQRPERGAGSRTPVRQASRRARRCRRSSWSSPAAISRAGPPASPSRSAGTRPASSARLELRPCAPVRPRRCARPARSPKSAAVGMTPGRSRRVRRHLAAIAMRASATAEAAGRQVVGGVAPARAAREARAGCPPRVRAAATSRRGRPAAQPAAPGELGCRRARSSRPRSRRSARARHRRARPCAAPRPDPRAVRRSRSTGVGRIGPVGGLVVEADVARDDRQAERDGRHRRCRRWPARAATPRDRSPGDPKLRQSVIPIGSAPAQATFMAPSTTADAPAR